MTFKKDPDIASFNLIYDVADWRTFSPSKHCGRVYKYLNLFCLVVQRKFAKKAVTININ